MVQRMHTVALVLLALEPTRDTHDHTLETPIAYRINITLATCDSRHIALVSTMLQ